MHRALEGGFVQRVHAAALGSGAQARDVVLLHVRFTGEARFVVAATGLGVGLLSASLRDRLREAMKQGSPRDKARWAEVLEAAGSQAEDDDLDARGARIVEALEKAESSGRRDALGRALTRATSRIERRIEAVRGDLAKAEKAQEMGRVAQLFVAEASRAPRGATRLVVQDWSTGLARDVELKLDPGKPARAQVDALFQRARRLKEGARIGQQRLADAERARAQLASIATELALAGPDVPALEARARAAAPRDFKLASGPMQPAPGRVKKQPPLPPYREFTVSHDARVRVGRGAETNDELTFHAARPHDLWLHAKNRTGAHVVVPLDKGASCPGDVLVDAAHLAAHFSEARGEDLVEIQYTPRRYVRKPKGSAPGLVVVDREKVLVLRVEPERLRRLLESESGETRS
jgi:predicted ribosome quality control (RQC) complex YloA/Tae2 family protein